MEEKSDKEFMQDLVGMNPFEKWMMNAIDRLEDQLYDAKVCNCKTKKAIVKAKYEQMIAVRHAYYNMINMDRK